MGTLTRVAILIVLLVGGTYIFLQTPEGEQYKLDSYISTTYPTVVTQGSSLTITATFNFTIPLGIPIDEYLYFINYRQYLISGKLLWLYKWDGISWIQHPVYRETDSNGQVSWSILVDEPVTELRYKVVFDGSGLFKPSESQVMIISVITSTEPSFSMTLSDSFKKIVQGSRDNVTLTLQSLNGFTGDVQLSWTDYVGISVIASVNPVPLSAGQMVTSTLTFIVLAEATVMDYTYTITGSSLNITQSVTLTISVIPPETAIIELTSSASNVVVGQTFDINVNTYKVHSLIHYTVRINFDSTLMSTTEADVTVYNIFPSSGAPIITVGLGYVEVTHQSTTTGVTGNFTLFKVTFTANMPTTTLTIISVDESVSILNSWDGVGPFVSQPYVTVSTSIVIYDVGTSTSILYLKAKGIADINGDGFVDDTDVNIVNNAYGSTIGDPNYNPEADINNDGIVDIDDVNYVTVVWGTTLIGIVEEYINASWYEVWRYAPFSNITRQVGEFSVGVHTLKLKIFYKTGYEEWNITDVNIILGETPPWEPIIQPYSTTQPFALLPFIQLTPEQLVFVKWFGLIIAIISGVGLTILICKRKKLIKLW
jgi:hypothetical protein